MRADTLLSKELEVPSPLKLSPGQWTDHDASTVDAIKNLNLLVTPFGQALIMSAHALTCDDLHLLWLKSSLHPYQIDAS